MPLPSREEEAPTCQRPCRQSLNAQTTSRTQPSRRWREEKCQQEASVGGSGPGAAERRVPRPERAVGPGNESKPPTRRRPRAPEAFHSTILRVRAVEPKVKAAC